MRLPNPTTTTWTLIGLGTVAAVGLAVAAKARKRDRPSAPAGSTCGGSIGYENMKVGEWVGDGAGGCRPQCFGTYKPAEQALWASGTGCVPIFDPGPTDPPVRPPSRTT